MVGRLSGERSLHGSPLEIARQAIARAKGVPGELEVYVQSGRTVSVKVFGGAVESVSVAEPRGLGIRAIQEGRTAYVFTSDLSSSGIDRALTDVKQGLAASDTDEYAGLPAVEASGYMSPPGLWHPGVSAMPLERKSELALEAEAAALAAAGVDTVEESVYSDEEARVGIASTCGVEAETEQSYSLVYVVAHAGSGVDRQSGLGYSAAREPGRLDHESAGREAAQKALALVGARPCPTGTYAVVLDREVVAALLSTVAQALSAEAVQRGRSVFAGRIGSMVASPGLTVSDDGLDPDGMATSPFDGEGVPQQNTVLVESGLLCSYLHDSRSARREGGRTHSTGSARRPSYRSLPRIGASNLVVSPGAGTLADLLGRVGEGLYVESVAGLHAGVNPVSGEVSLGASGRLFSAGSLGAPVREVTIATGFQQLLQSVVDIAGDSRWIPVYGSVCAPSLALSEVTVAGV